MTSDRCAIDGCHNPADTDGLLCEDCRAMLDRGLAANRRYADRPHKPATTSTPQTPMRSILPGTTPRSR